MGEISTPSFMGFAGLYSLLNYAKALHRSARFYIVFTYFEIMDFLYVLLQEAQLSIVSTKIGILNKHSHCCISV